MQTTGKKLDYVLLGLGCKTPSATQRLRMPTIQELKRPEDVRSPRTHCHRDGLQAFVTPGSGKYRVDG